MKIAIAVSRTLLGIGFIVFGSNILHPFLPMPAPPAGSLTAQFMGVMYPTHWMALIGLFQLVGGILVIVGRTAPLGLVLLGPVLVNILAFHILIMGGQGIQPGLVFSVLEIFLVYAYRDHFKALFTVNALPA
jgi:putative oxidoreductase